MPARPMNARRYLDSLRDDREVWIGGRRVTVGANSAADRILRPRLPLDDMVPPLGMRPTSVRRGHFRQQPGIDRTQSGEDRHGPVGV